MKKNYWFIAGILSALAFGAFANIPTSGSPSGEMAVTPEVSEIKAQRQAELSFDADLKQLQAKQGRYRENLPLSKREGRDSIRLQRSSSQRKAAPKKSISKRKPSSAAKAKLGRAKCVVRRR